MPYFLIALDTPDPLALAEELGQKLLGRQVVKSGFPISAFGSLALMEFPDANQEQIDRVQSEIASWISDKHRSLRLRKLSGKRQAQNLGMPSEAQQEIICLEIRK